VNQSPPESSILQSISEGVFTVDKDWKITSFNRAAQLITGYKTSEALGELCSDIFKSSLCKNQCPIRHSFITGDPVIDRHCFFINKSGEKKPVSVSSAVLKNETEIVIGGAETFRDMSEIMALRNELTGLHQMDGFETRSPSMANVFHLIQAVAPTPSTVLILGETGTGKELIAKTIHSSSDRKDQPWVAINCSALTETLLESELFGHVRGAFTGAVRDKEGLFKRAGRGTLFLDEIGDISPALQVRLLRVLQEKEYTPVGGSVVQKSKARIIAGTNRNLQELIIQGKFRKDLYYRLNVVRIEIPPLRERAEDIPQLSQKFLNHFAQIYNRPNLSLSPHALSILQSYDWPGNVRELENIIERLCIVNKSSEIGPMDFPEEIFSQAINEPLKKDAALKTLRGIAERPLIESAIKSSKTKAEAAQKLGIHKATLYRKIQELGIPL
jgi:PAS domain S-box-containing protein